MTENHERNLFWVQGKQLLLKGVRYPPPLNDNRAQNCPICKWNCPIKFDLNLTRARCLINSRLGRDFLPHFLATASRPIKPSNADFGRVWFRKSSQLRLSLFRYTFNAQTLLPTGPPTQASQSGVFLLITIRLEIDPGFPTRQPETGYARVTAGPKTFDRKIALHIHRVIRFHSFQVPAGAGFTL